MNPLGYRVSHFYHKALNPTTVPVIIDNRLFMMTEQQNRHIVDTKLSFLVPYPFTSDGTWIYPDSMQWQPNVQYQPPTVQYQPPTVQYQPLTVQHQPPTVQQQPIQTTNPMAGNIEQQLHLERMHAQYVMDMINANAKQQLINQSLTSNSNAATTSPCVFQDASTHTYDLVQSNDVDMKSVR